MLTERALDATYVTVPSLEIHPSDDGIVVRNTVLGTRFVGPPSIVTLLDAFRSPARMRARAAELDIEVGMMAIAIANGFLFDVDLLLAKDPSPIGAPQVLSSFLAADRSDRRVALFGATSDGAATGRAGARHGPREIRAASHFPFLRNGVGAFTPEGTSSASDNPFAMETEPEDPVFLDFETRHLYRGTPPDVVDLGDLQFFPGESIASYGARLRLLTAMALGAGAIPGMLGGDHSVTWYALEAVLARHGALGIIHFDAHHDQWPPFAPHLDYVMHDNAFFHALRSPRVARLFQIGVRTFESARPSELSKDPRLSYVSPSEVARSTPEEIFRDLPRDIPYYLTFDVDCIDPVFVPETGTPVPGGLTPYQALALVDHAARSFRLVGWDVVEVSQSEGRVNAAASVASRVVRQLLLAGMERQPLSDYRRAG